jgi:photosystem II stability/assembly factor-like uncharacterized protein
MPQFVMPLLFAALALHWSPQASNTTAGLRGLSVASNHVVWASGSKGTILRTLDGGTHWELRTLAGGDALDFRDVVAFGANVALVMSSGTGDAARVYKTKDGGITWKIVLPNPDKNGFFDAMKFWDSSHGMLLGDPVDGQFTILTTDDAGTTWSKAAQPKALVAQRAQAVPAASACPSCAYSLKEEGAFAASGTCLSLHGTSEAWFGSGGPGGGRVFHTSDRGRTWTVTTTPLAGTVASSGIFSLTFFSLKFMDVLHGVAVGGDYQQPTQTERSLAVTSNGGKTWIIPSNGPMGGFRSAVTWLKSKRLLIAVGTSGSDYSTDGGFTWQPLSKDMLNAVASQGGSVWAVGPKGLILKLALHR